MAETADREAPARVRDHLPRQARTSPTTTWTSVKERVRGIVNREGGKVIRFTVWGKKKTMYPIAKQPRAIYVHAHYLGGTHLVAEVERNLRNLDEVTRYLSREDRRRRRPRDPSGARGREAGRRRGRDPPGPAPRARGSRPREASRPTGLDEEAPEEA